MVQDCIRPSVFILICSYSAQAFIQSEVASYKKKNISQSSTVAIGIEITRLVYIKHAVG